MLGFRHCCILLLLTLPIVLRKLKIAFLNSFLDLGLVNFHLSEAGLAQARLSVKINSSLKHSCMGKLFLAWAKSSSPGQALCRLGKPASAASFHSGPISTKRAIFAWTSL